jgi:hypothetical protein
VPHTPRGVNHRRQKAKRSSTFWYPGALLY